MSRAGRPPISTATTGTPTCESTTAAAVRGRTVRTAPTSTDRCRGRATGSSAATATATGPSPTTAGTTADPADGPFLAPAGEGPFPSALRTAARPRPGVAGVFGRVRGFAEL